MLHTESLSKFEKTNQWRLKKLRTGRDHKCEPNFEPTKRRLKNMKEKLEIAHGWSHHMGNVVPRKKIMQNQAM